MGPTIFIANNDVVRTWSSGFLSQAVPSISCRFQKPCSILAFWLLSCVKVVCKNVYYQRTGGVESHWHGSRVSCIVDCNHWGPKCFPSRIRSRAESQITPVSCRSGKAFRDICPCSALTLAACDCSNGGLENWVILDCYLTTKGQCDMEVAVG